MTVGCTLEKQFKTLYRSRWICCITQNKHVKTLRTEQCLLHSSPEGTMIFLHLYGKSTTPTAWHHDPKKSR